MDCSMPCPSSTPGAYSNSCSLSQWCHLTTSSSVVPFSSHLQSFPASGSFPMSQFFASGGQSIGVSASACPSNEYSGLISFRTGWFDLLRVQGTLKSLLQHHSLKASVLLHWAFFMVQFSQPYITTRKTIALTIRTFVGKVMSLLFNMLSRFVISCKSWAEAWVTEWARLRHCPLRITSLKTEELMMKHHLEIYNMIRYICQEMSFLYNRASFPIMLMVITIRLMDIL